MSVYDEIVERAERLRSHPTVLKVMVDAGEDPLDVVEVLRLALALHLEVLDMTLMLARAVDELAGD